MRRSPVLVLDANQRSALAVTRALGRRGIPVITADTRRRALASASRFSAASFAYPDPYEDADGFVAAVLAEAAARGVRVLLPVTDITASVLQERRDDLHELGFPFPSPETFFEWTDKAALLEKARARGIPTPPSAVAHDAAELARLGAGFGYPYVAKPFRSVVRDRDRWRATQVSVIRSPSEAARMHRDPTQFPVLVQAYVEGAGAGISAAYYRGEALGFFAHKRVREKPPSGGVSVVSESVEPSAAMVGYSKRLLDSAGWHGVAMVEFRVSGDGVPYLMEINGRLWGSLQLAIDAGADFPMLLYELGLGGAPARFERYEVGLRNRWLLGDVDHLYLSLRELLRSSAPARGYFSLFSEFFNLSRKKQRFDVNRINDLAPFVTELLQYVARRR
jgi:predicted ATP-grasp superfamily ATP-dependent carboligase